MASTVSVTILSTAVLIDLPNLSSHVSYFGSSQCTTHIISWVQVKSYVASVVMQAILSRVVIDREDGAQYTILFEPAVVRHSSMVYVSM